MTREIPNKVTRFAPAIAPAETSNSRTFRATFSDESIDRYGDTIKATGWKFAAEVPLLFGHDAGSIDNFMGVGKNIRIDGSRLVGDLAFVPEGVNSKADTVCEAVRQKFLKTVSVGFAPIEWEPTRDKSRPGGVDFKKQELWELSIVPIPANPNAVIAAKAAGLDLERLGLTLPERTPKMNAITPMRRAPAAVTTPSPSRDFKSIGDFAAAVARSATDDARPDPRLVRFPGAGHSGESDTAGGGFLVPSVVEQDILASVYAESPIVPMLRRLKSTKPFETSFPAAGETSRISGSRWGGAQAFWIDEANAPANYTVARTRAIDFVPRKLIALAPVSNELLADAPMLTDYLNLAVASEFAFLLELALISGTGAGQPLGILKASGTITVAKDSGQAAATLTLGNIENMWARLPGPCRKRAVWLMNEDAEAQISSAAATSPSTADMYAPQGIGGNPYPLLKGRPVLVSEACSPLGTPGDVVLFDPSLYGVLDPGIQAALSLDFFYTSDQALFRFVWRTDAKPLIQTPLTPANGSGITRSPYVVLAQR